MSEYSIKWVKGLRYADLCYVNCLSLMRLYHYNLRHAETPYPSTIAKNIVISDAEKSGIFRVRILMRTPSDEKFNLDFFMNENEAEYFKKRMIDDFYNYNRKDD